MMADAVVLEAAGYGARILRSGSSAEGFRLCGVSPPHPIFRFPSWTQSLHRRATPRETIAVQTSCFAERVDQISIMVRKLKYHEQKLLRKTDFITYKQDGEHRDKAVIRRYMIQKPEDYFKYARLCGVSVLTASWPQATESVQLLTASSPCVSSRIASRFSRPTTRCAASTKSFSSTSCTTWPSFPRRRSYLQWRTA